MDRIEQFSTIAPDIGNIFRYISTVTAVPLLVALIYREWEMVLPMASVPVTLFLLGSLLAQVPRQEREAPLSAALMAVALIWLVCALVSALPFTFGLGVPYLDGVFEAMSGWTDTGMTMMRSVEDLPRTLLFWRSLMQWLGGIGVVAFTIAMASRTGLTQYRLYRSEGRSEALMPSVVATGLEMWKIYLALTIASIGLILLSGISLWDSVNIALSAISTGGFSIHSEGIPFYNNPLLEVLIVPVMIAGALPFKLYYFLYRRKKVRFFDDQQARLLFILVALGIVVIAWDLVTLTATDVPTAIRQALFMSAAAVTSTGFQTASPNEWASVTVLFLSMLIVIGGSSGSTAGGIKLSRVVLAIQSLLWWFRRMFVSGKVLVPFRYEGRVIPKNIADLEISRNMLVIMLYFLTIFVATVLVMHLQPTAFDSSNVIFEVVSAMCNNGMTTGFVSPDMAGSAKVLFIAIMWIGRLEIIPVIMLFMGIFKGPA
ncbi:MAG TPA: TrkH family potassium uptake protein [Candidatus Methanoculleus thermohydrogenotrophicum]|jgi:trk system potassium uptake protein TrkH|nr:TrkH family potassium uptake protein [Candidatus Methanoculleus thermohydrogenotrophicum]NLM81912.1 TrkH family potassium uptake protein [Candidatus Methanoculleus thermohydrogenotrophicum]HOB17829.1 TrkH family potassium uptake protein [Candidatus Methanoculleus thermohydrogenotrophicum]HPZ37987.1 TrkH family potassium uptake protein [Candidatus Methanoculleus thermohydrogenotrophicum]HQC91185.1 TrkH family potassium uptake protein [Candidatus Methanoculleus thermohydrogenotrophicum]